MATAKQFNIDENLSPDAVSVDMFDVRSAPDLLLRLQDNNQALENLLRELERDESAMLRDEPGIYNNPYK
ncbi:hypothetical protein FPY71_08425 [Aureimonas fodinaquatilis]|uniref:Uncharacterized protein n=1 Tax=Aureimonas fodinaquatilis TaxID=2565783 RepID=A0A5B0DX00_9HYPH|nr:hypothetical protein [Aureimonas fodinaquatilis]KAA0970522.1 hypothetical protein FPY71_08425 [Aureimonas fodinaquatilis]